MNHQGSPKAQFTLTTLSWHWPLRHISQQADVLNQISSSLPLLPEKAMAPHSSTTAWKIPWTEEPGRLQSMGSLESDTTERLHFHFSLSCIGEGNGNPLVFLPGESQGWRSLVDFRLWGCTESDTTEAT